MRAAGPASDSLRRSNGRAIILGMIYSPPEPPYELQLRGFEAGRASRQDYRPASLARLLLLLFAARMVGPVHRVEHELTAGELRVRRSAGTLPEDWRFALSEFSEAELVRESGARGATHYYLVLRRHDSNRGVRFELFSGKGLAGQLRFGEAAAAELAKSWASAAGLPLRKP